MWAGLGVHDRTEWVFMMDQNWCSPSAEYASTVSQADKDELLGIIEQNARVISRQESRIKTPAENPFPETFPEPRYLLT